MRKIVFLLLALFVGLLAACGGSTENSTNNGAVPLGANPGLISGTAEASLNGWTAVFYDNTGRVLGSAPVANGEFALQVAAEHPGTGFLTSPQGDRVALETAGGNQFQLALDEQMVMNNVTLGAQAATPQSVTGGEFSQAANLHPAAQENVELRWGTNEQPGATSAVYAFTPTGEHDGVVTIPGYGSVNYVVNGSVLLATDVQTDRQLRLIAVVAPDQSFRGQEERWQGGYRRSLLVATPIQ